MEIGRHMKISFKPISHQKIESTTYRKWISDDCRDYYKPLAETKMWLNPYIGLSSTFETRHTDRARSRFHVTAILMCKVAALALGPSLQWAALPRPLLLFFIYGCNTLNIQLALRHLHPTWKSDVWGKSNILSVIRQHAERGLSFPSFYILYFP